MKILESASAIVGAVRGNLQPTVRNEATVADGKGTGMPAPIPARGAKVFLVAPLNSLLDVVALLKSLE